MTRRCFSLKKISSSLIVKRVKDPGTEVDVDFKFAFYWPLVRSYIENNTPALKQRAYSEPGGWSDGIVFVMNGDIQVI